MYAVRSKDIDGSTHFYLRKKEIRVYIYKLCINRRKGRECTTQKHINTHFFRRASTHIKNKPVLRDFGIHIYIVFLLLCIDDIWKRNCWYMNLIWSHNMIFIDWKFGAPSEWPPHDILVSSAVNSLSYTDSYSSKFLLMLLQMTEDNTKSRQISYMRQ